MSDACDHTRRHIWVPDDPKATVVPASDYFPRHRLKWVCDACGVTLDE